MWQTGSVNPAQEHFITNLIRQKLVSAIDNVKPSETKPTKKIIFFLPEGELHEISLLLYSYMAKTRGYSSVYLGQSVPLDDLIKIKDIVDPHSVVSVFTQPLKDGLLQDYLEQLVKIFNKQNILVSGFQLIHSEIKLPKKVKLFKTPADFSKFL
jgi:methanogenic corrinoid protein MtbC1